MKHATNVHRTQERPWEIWVFAAAFIALFFMFARSQMGAEPASARPIARPAALSANLAQDTMAAFSPGR